jgi:hypothetical protein
MTYITSFTLTAVALTVRFLWRVFRAHLEQIDIERL